MIGLSGQYAAVDENLTGRENLVLFGTNVFVPTQTLPSLLRPIAEWNPVSARTAATRKLWGNPNPYAAEGSPAEQPVLLTLIWVAVMLAVFVPLAVRKYRSISR